MSRNSPGANNEGSEIMNTENDDGILWNTLIREGADEIGIAVCKEEDYTPLDNLIRCLDIIRHKAKGHKIVIENHEKAYLGIAVFCPEENFKREDFETLRELNCVSVYHEHREYYGSMHYYFTLYPTDSQ